MRLFSATRGSARLGGGRHIDSLTTDPALVLNLHGNKCTVRTKEGTVLKDIHLEDVLAVPDNATNYEKAPLQPEDDPLEVDVESLDQKRSPGMMLEDKERKERGGETDKAGKPISPGKLEQVHTGNLWAYAYEGNRKIAALARS